MGTGGNIAGAIVIVIGLFFLLMGVRGSQSSIFPQIFSSGASGNFGNDSVIKKTNSSKGTNL